MTHPNIRLVSRESNLRRYTYKARVCRTTGRLLGIRAGCRDWSSWSQAFDHYSLTKPTRPNGTFLKWDRRWIATYGPEKRRELHAARLEAIALLSKLRSQVQQVQERIRAKRRKK